MKKILLGLVVSVLLFSSGCWGQSGSAGTSVYMTLGTNLTAPATTANVTNIGQVGHQLIVQLSNAPAKTCTFSNVTVGGSLQFSYDNSTWNSFGNPSSTELNNPNSSGAATYFGTGAYPYVRFSLTSFDTVNCLATVYYTGSTQQGNLTPTSTIIGGLVGTIGSNQTAFTPIPLTPVGTVNNARAYPLIQCGNRFNSTGTTYAAGTYLLGMFTAQITGPPVAGVGICNIEASANTAGSFQIFLSTTSDCLGTIGGNRFGTIYMPANGSFSMGEGTGLIYIVNANNTNAQYVCATITGSVYLGGMWASL